MHIYFLIFMYIFFFMLLILYVDQMKMHNAVIEHKIELQFKMNDVKKINKEKKHAYFNEIGHKKRKKQQNNQKN